MRILDISVPGNPTPLGKTRPFINQDQGDLPDRTDLVEDIDVQGDFAYVAAGDAGLRVIDVSDPTSPTSVGFYEVVGARGVQAVGQYVYLDHGSFSILDVSNPRRPTEIGGFSPNGGHAFTVVGDYLYIAGGFASNGRETGLQIFDVSVPSAAGKISYHLPLVNPFDIVYFDGYLYLAGGVLWKFDLSDPVNPREIAEYDWTGTSGTIYADLFMTQNYAFLADGVRGLRMADLSNAGQENPAKSVEFESEAVDVYVDQGFAYVSTTRNGLRIVDVSDPYSMYEVSPYETMTSAVDVFAVGDYAYVADEYQGLRIVDVYNPANYVVVGGYDAPGGAVDIHVIDGYAYVAWSKTNEGIGSGLRIVGVQSPKNPRLVGRFEVESETKDIHVKLPYVYLTTDNGLWVIDVTDPSSPTKASHFENWVYRKLFVTGDYAYMTGTGLNILRVTNPQAPVELGNSYPSERGR